MAHIQYNSNFFIKSNALYHNVCYNKQAVIVTACFIIFMDTLGGDNG